MISKKLAIEVLNIALETGADFAEIYLEENIASRIEIDNCKVESSNDTLTFGAGIRLLKGLHSGYGYTNDISKKGLSKLAYNLSQSYNDKRCITVEKIDKVRGMDIVIVTTAKTDKEAKALLEKVGLPFKA